MSAAEPKYEAIAVLANDGALKFEGFVEADGNSESTIQPNSHAEAEALLVTDRNASPSGSEAVEETVTAPPDATKTSGDIVKVGGWFSAGGDNNFGLLMTL